MSTDEAQPTVQEKLEEAGIEVKEEIKKPPYKEGAVWLSESIDLNHLYRVKGLQGLFTPRAKPNKAGMLPMRSFMGDALKMVKQTSLEALGGAVIYQDNYTVANIQDTITLEEAFDNLQEHFDSKTTGDITDVSKEMIMEIICPDFDEDKFKDHHAKKIIGWYNIIIYSINKAEE